ncbi:MAG: glycosyltransferase [Bryocella sp.]
MPAPLPSPVHVLFQTEFEAMGGAERSLLALSRWLHQHNRPHILLTYIDHCNIASHAAHPVNVVELRPAMKARAKIAALKRYIREYPPLDAPLLSGYQSSMHAALAGLGRTHCLMHDTPDLFEVAHQLTLQQRARRWLSNRIVARNLRSGGHTIVTSEHLQSEVQHLFGVHADIVRMGGLASAHTFTPRRVDTTLRLLSVSRLEDNKRIDWLLRALAALELSSSPLSTRIDWHFDILGKGSQLIALQSLATSLGIASRVHFHGYVTDEQLENFFAQTHLFLMPAVQGYGIPAVEALARGIPVLLHRDSGVSDILTDTPWATIVDGGETNLLPALTSAIDHVLRDEHLTAPPPPVPTEEEWAERVATLCDWVR